MSYLRPLALLVLGAVTLTGCATYSPDVYQAGQVQQVQSVELGTVEAVRSVQIQGKSNELYTLGGTVLGGLAGSTIGRGTGSVAGAVAGAMLGGTAAHALHSSGGTQPGLSITVRLDSGRLVNIVQNANVNIQPGQRVQVLSGAGAARVEPI